MAQPPCRSPSKVKSFFCEIVVESKSLFCVGERNKEGWLSGTKKQLIRAPAHNQTNENRIFCIDNFLAHFLFAKSLVFGEYLVNVNVNKLYKTYKHISDFGGLVGWFRFRPILDESSLALDFQVFAFLPLVMASQKKYSLFCQDTPPYS